MPTVRINGLARIALLSCLVSLGADAMARGVGRSEFDSLAPGMDNSLNWVLYREAAAEALRSKKPVMLYLYEGVKNRENVQEMIAAQFRLFTEKDVQDSAASLVCTRADRLKPEDVIAQLPARREGFLDPEEGKKDAEGEGEGEGEDEKPFDPRKSAPDEPAAGFLMDPKDWPDEICLVFLDYRGRKISDMLEITSRHKDFVSTVKGVIAANAKRVTADERAAEAEAKKRAREEAARLKAEAEAEAAKKEGGDEEQSEEKDSPEGEER